MKLKYISWLPAVVIMVFIFLYSSKPADSSNESSLTIAKKVVTIYETVTEHRIDTVNRLTILEKVNHIIRKGAHFSEYALLSFLIAFHLLVCKKSRAVILWYSTITAAIYAMTDEYHQTFIEGRSGQLNDVLIDTIGAFSGALFFILLIKVLRRLQEKRKSFT